MLPDALRPSRGDVALIAALVALALALLAVPVIVSAGESSGPPIAKIEGPYGEVVVPLEGSREVRVKGALGELLVRVDEGGIRVSEADCPNQVCVQTGSVSEVRSAIVCVPNGVTVQVETEGIGGGLDAVVR